MGDPRKPIIEFIGTFFLVLTVGTAVAHAEAFAPLAIGASLMVMVFAGGHISGGHFNPAVSIAVFLRGKLSSSDLSAYIVAQIVGGVVAALVVSLLGDTPDAAADFPVGKSLIAELLFTFALCFVVLQVATSRGTDGNSFYGLAIGFTVVVGAYAVGAHSGGAFNPAVTIGALVMGMFKAKALLYLVWQVIAAALAAAAYKVTNTDDLEPHDPVTAG